MSQKFLFRLFVVTAIILGVVLVLSADTRIRFEKLGKPATVSGKIETGGRVCYVAKAERGQTLKAEVRSRSGKVRIFESGETTYQSAVEYAGDQSVCVDNLGSATNYRLVVSVA